MKTLFRKLTALLTACSLAASLALPAAASDALGQDLTAKDTLLNQQTQLSTNVFWSESSANFRTENLVTYEPNERVTPIVAYGAVVTEKSTVSAAAQQLEAQGKRVVAAVNGDFYVVSSGVPVGLVITDGLLRSSDGGFHAIGFRADGTALLGKPGLTVDARFAYTMEEGAPMEIRRRPCGPPPSTRPGRTPASSSIPTTSTPPTPPAPPSPAWTWCAPFWRAHCPSAER